MKRLLEWKAMNNSNSIPKTALTSNSTTTTTSTTTSGPSYKERLENLFNYNMNHRKTLNRNDIEFSDMKFEDFTETDDSIRIIYSERRNFKELNQEIKIKLAVIFHKESKDWWFLLYINDVNKKNEYGQGFNKLLDLIAENLSKPSKSDSIYKQIWEAANISNSTIDEIRDYENLWD
jgi:hypothetical protein